MNKKKLLGGFLISLVCINTHALEISGSVGETGQNAATYRLDLSSSWNQKWLESNVGYITGEWDYGLTYWEAGSEAGGRFSISASPVFRYEFKTMSITPFIQAGVGLALFNGTSAGDKEFGSIYNFEDRIGAGIRFKNGQSVGIRAFHYSNAGIKQPNDGIESYALYYSIPL